MRALWCLLALLAGLVCAPAAQAQRERYRATLSGPGASPANNAISYGLVDILIDRATWTMTLSVTTSDFTGGDAHIHCCTGAGLSGTSAVATMLPTFPDFPDYNTFWRDGYERTFDLNDAGTYSAAFLAASGGSVHAARNELMTGIASQRAYFNVHTHAHPQGQMRGFLVPTPVPEPHSWAMFMTGIALLFAARRARPGRWSG